MSKTKFLTSVGRKIIETVGRRRHYDWITWMVPLPETPDDPPCLLVSIATGPRQRIMMRYRDMAEYLAAVTPSVETQAKIADRLTVAHERARELRQAAELSRLAGERKLARTDTGERIEPVGEAPAPEADPWRETPQEAEARQEEYDREFRAWVARRD